MRKGKENQLTMVLVEEKETYWAEEGTLEEEKAKAKREPLKLAGGPKERPKRKE